MIDELSRVPLEFSPGEAWNYSVSTDILGYLVGKISGMPFEEFLKTRIFEPLGMVDTGFHVPPEKAERFAACYAFDAKGKVVLQDDPAKSPYLKPPVFVSGGGGLVGTAAGLHEILPDAAGRRLGERPSLPLAEDAGADDAEPSARQSRDDGDVALAVQRKRQ